MNGFGEGYGCFRPGEKKDGPYHLQTMGRIRSIGLSATASFAGLVEGQGFGDQAD
jgi:hypothetical protein